MDELFSQNITVKIIEPGVVVSSNFGSEAAKKSRTLSLFHILPPFCVCNQRDFDRLRSSRVATEEDVRQRHLRSGNRWNGSVRHVATESK